MSKFILDVEFHSRIWEREYLTNPVEMNQTYTDFTYDAFYQLLTEARTAQFGSPVGLYSHTYAYDLAGNRTSKDSQASTFSSDDKLLTSPAAQFTYDDAGATKTRQDGSPRSLNPPHSVIGKRRPLPPGPPLPN